MVPKNFDPFHENERFTIKIRRKTLVVMYYIRAFCAYFIPFYASNRLQQIKFSGALRDT